MERGWALVVQTDGPADGMLLVRHFPSTSEEIWQMLSTRSVQDPAWEPARGLVDAERLRIARELHDVVSFSFATISVQAGVAAHVADQRPELAVDALRAIKAISSEASRELRGILGLLRRAGDPETPSHGLAGLDALAATATSAGLPTRVVITGRPGHETAAVDAAAYRIVQEALANALRYAGPAAASGCVAREPDQLTVEVLDDGRGVSPHPGERPPGSGHGIPGMRERARQLGGALYAGPRLEGGFRVRAWLPIGGRS
jgi:signal transduction histidine kinase